MPSLEKLTRSYLKAVVADITEKEIIIRLETGQDLIWPREKFVQNLEINQEVILELKTAENQKQERQEVAKALLEEILQEDLVAVDAQKVAISN